MTIRPTYALLVLLVLAFACLNQVDAQPTKEGPPVRVRLDRDFLNTVLQSGEQSLGAVITSKPIPGFSFKTDSGRASTSNVKLLAFERGQANQPCEIRFEEAEQQVISAIIDYRAHGTLNVVDDKGGAPEAVSFIVTGINVVNAYRIVPGTEQSALDVNKNGSMLSMDFDRIALTQITVVSSELCAAGSEELRGELEHRIQELIQQHVNPLSLIEEESYHLAQLELVVPYFTLEALLRLSTSARVSNEAVEFGFDIESYLAQHYIEQSDAYYQQKQVFISEPQSEFSEQEETGPNRKALQVLVDENLFNYGFFLLAEQNRTYSAREEMAKQDKHEVRSLLPYMTVKEAEAAFPGWIDKYGSRTQLDQSVSFSQERIKTLAPKMLTSVFNMDAKGNFRLRFNLLSDLLVDYMNGQAEPGYGEEWFRIRQMAGYFGSKGKVVLEDTKDGRQLFHFLPKTSELTLYTMLDEDGKESKAELMRFRAGLDAAIDDARRKVFPLTTTVGFIPEKYTNCSGAVSVNDRVRFGRGYFELNFGYAKRVDEISPECIGKDEFEKILRDPRGALRNAIATVKEQLPIKLQALIAANEYNIQDAEKQLPPRMKDARKRKEEKNTK